MIDRLGSATFNPGSCMDASPWHLQNWACSMVLSSRMRCIECECRSPVSTCGGVFVEPLSAAECSILCDGIPLCWNGAIVQANLQCSAQCWNSCHWNAAGIKMFWYDGGRGCQRPIRHANTPRRLQHRLRLCIEERNQARCPTSLRCLSLRSSSVGYFSRAARTYTDVQPVTETPIRYLLVHVVPRRIGRVGGHGAHGLGARPALHWKSVPRPWA